MQSTRRAVLAAIGALCLFVSLAPTRAAAIPAFARRYETSCQTCHVSYPKLTPFGEAFRRNAYRFPAGADETMQKKEPLPLGGEANEERWPSAVWPGELPVELPLSILIDGQAWYGPHIDPLGGHGALPRSAAKAAATVAPATDDHAAHLQARFAVAGAAGDAHEEEAESQLALGSLGGQIGLRTGGTLGELASFFGAINFGGHAPIEIERANLVFTPIDSSSLLLKVGRFEPALHGVTVHRGLVGHMLRLTTLPVGNNPFTPEMFSTGVEASSVVAHRLGLAAAVVENATPGLYLEKDAYARAEYKFGGMALDGVGAEAATAPWRERSITLGGSGYLGRSNVGLATEQLDRFWRVGADAHLVMDDLMLDVVAVRQRHSAPVSGDDQPATFNQLFAELTYVTLPVLFPSVRFETSEESYRGQKDTRWQGLGVINGVIYPNLLLRTMVGVGADDGEHPGFRFAGLAVSTAF